MLSIMTAGAQIELLIHPDRHTDRFPTQRPTTLRMPVGTAIVCKRKVLAAPLLIKSNKRRNTKTVYQKEITLPKSRVHDGP